MKKTLASILALAFCFAVCMSAYAIDVEPYAAAPTMTGYLYDDEGNCVEVTGYLVETNNIAPLSAERNTSLTYAYYLSSTDFSNTASEPDSGYSSTVYLTINYTTRPIENYTESLLTSVSGSWEIHDSRVSVTSANVSYSCIGLGTAYQSGSSSVSNNIPISTGFTRYASEVDQTLGATLTLKYLMGTSRTWTFTLQNYK